MRVLWDKRRSGASHPKLLVNAWTVVYSLVQRKSRSDQFSSTVTQAMLLIFTVFPRLVTVVRTHRNCCPSFRCSGSRELILHTTRPTPTTCIPRVNKQSLNALKRERSSNRHLITEKNKESRNQKERRKSSSENAASFISLSRAVTVAFSPDLCSLARYHS